MGSASISAKWENPIGHRSSAEMRIDNIFQHVKIEKVTNALYLPDLMVPRVFGYGNIRKLSERL